MAKLDVRFTATELDELNGAVSAVEFRGARLPDAVLVLCAKDVVRSCSLRRALR